jgi:hypothetical protein
VPESTVGNRAINTAENTAATRNNVPKAVHEIPDKTGTRFGHEDRIAGETDAQ